MTARRVALLLAWSSAAAALIGFVQPWAFIEVRSTAAQGLSHNAGRIVLRLRRGTETITGDLPNLADIPRQVSGADIPRMVGEEHAQIAMAVLELLTQTRQHAGAKSSLVYLVPGIAAACALALTLSAAPASAGIVGLVCAAIAAIGGWHLMTAPTKSLLIAIRIGPGLWLSLCAYVGLAAAAVVAACGLTRRSKA